MMAIDNGLAPPRMFVLLLCNGLSIDPRSWPFYGMKIVGLNLNGSFVSLPEQA